MLGVSPDAPAKNARFREKRSFPYTLLSDTDHELAAAYGAWGPKTFMGRTFEGMHRTTVLVDAEGLLREIWREVKIKGHVGAVLAAAESLR